MDWLTEKLRQEIKLVFEPRYNRRLTSGEVEEIATNYVSLFEGLAKQIPEDNTEITKGKA